MVQRDVSTADPPTKYASLPPPLVTVLVASIGHLREFDGPSAASLWEYLDRLDAASIATLVEVHQAAVRLGIWPNVRTLRHVYAGSSWGFEFDGNGAGIRGLVAGDPKWCNDAQRFVRPEHGNTAHDWWRCCENPVGQRGIHVGVDAGAGYSNLHYDSQNPARGRYSSHWYNFLSPFAVGAMLADSEACDYSLSAVIAHNADIHSTGGHNSPVPYAEIPLMKYSTRRLRETVGYEKGDPRGDQAGIAGIEAAVAALETAVEAFDRDAREQAGTNDPEGNAASAGLLGRATTIEVDVISRLKDVAGFIDRSATALGEPRSDDVDLSGAFETTAVGDWPSLTTHVVDDLVGSYFSLAEQRRKPLARRRPQPPMPEW